MTDFQAHDLLFEATGLNVVDVAANTAASHFVNQLQNIHFRYFPGHEHVIEEIRAYREKPTGSSIRHAWLMHRGDSPVGEFIFHTCPQRGIAVLHYVAVNEEARASFPVGWFEHLISSVTLQAELDLASRSKSLLAIAAEVQNTSRWDRTGFHTVDVGYQEPHHGMHWSDFGSPLFRHQSCRKNYANWFRRTLWAINGIHCQGVSC